MAQKTVVTLIDDIDGERADETVRFGLDDVSYEIDLRKVNADKLRAIFQPFQTAGRKTTGGLSPRGRTRRDTRSPGEAGDRSAQIRAWAKQHGLPVSERGRLPTTLVAAYQANDPTQISGTQPPQPTSSG